MDAELKISRAKSVLIAKEPFFGSIVLGLPFIEDENIPTMCTDARCIRWNRSFVDSMTGDETVFVVAHEVLHVAFLHCLPLPVGYDDPELSNIAMDFVINDVLVTRGMTMPKGGLLDKKYDGWTWMRVYNDLRSNPDQKPQQCPWGIAKEATDDNGDKLSDGAAKALEADIKQQVLQAAQAAERSAGSLPAAIKQLVEEMRKPQIDWSEVAERFIGGEYPFDYSQRRVNRRMLSMTGVFCPTIDKFGAGDIVYACDTSASVNDVELQQALGEINALSEDYGATSITVITFDTKVQSAVEYDAGCAVTDIKVQGRGGTAVQPVFDYIEDNDIQCDKLIVFTDGGIFDYPEDAPDYPVLWISTDKCSAPFGEIAQIRVAA